MGDSILKRLVPEAKRLLTDDFMSGEKERIEPAAYRELLEPFERPVSLTGFHETLDLLIEETEPFSGAVDELAAPAIHQNLRLTRREAADVGMWRYLAVIERPDFVRHRWKTFNSPGLHYWQLAIRPEANTFARLWWIAELTHDGEGYERTRKVFSSQTLVNWLFKNRLSHHHPTALACIDLLGGDGSDVSTSEAEEVIQELSARLTLIPAECLSYEAAVELISSIMEAQGVQRPSQPRGSSGLTLSRTQKPGPQMNGGGGGEFEPVTGDGGDDFPEKHGESWTAEEEDRLLTMVANQRPLAELTAQFKRTARAIRLRLLLIRDEKSYSNLPDIKDLFITMAALAPDDGPWIELEEEFVRLASRRNISSESLVPLIGRPADAIESKFAELEDEVTKPATTTIGSQSSDSPSVSRNVEASAATVSSGQQDPDSGLCKRLRAVGVSLDQPWDDFFFDMSARIEKALIKEQISTIGDLARLIDRERLEELPNVGPTTAQPVRDKVTRLAEVGGEHFKYGPGGTPESLEELVEIMLSEFDKDERELLKMRFWQGKTLAEVGDAFGLTRERIRQKEAQFLEFLEQKYGQLADELLEPIKDVLGGESELLHFSQLQSLAEVNLADLGLVLRVAGYEFQRWLKNFITLDLEAVETEFAALKEDLKKAARLEFVPATLIRLADEYDLYLTTEGAREIIESYWDIESDEDGVYPNPWLNKGDKISGLLAEAGRTLTLDEVTQYFAREYGEEYQGVEREHVQPHLKRHPDIFTCDYGEYVHRDHLPVGYHRLMAAAKWVVEHELKGEKNTISINDLLSEVRDADLLTPDEFSRLNEYLFRDTLFLFDDVAGFQNSFNVGWRPSLKEGRRSLAEHVEEALLNADGVTTVNGIIEALPEYLEFTPETVGYYLGGKSFSIKIDVGKFIHRENLDLSEKEQTRLLNDAFALVPEDGEVVSCVQINGWLKKKPSWRSFTSRELAPNVIWGLLRHHSDIQAGSRLLVTRGEFGRGELLAHTLVETVRRIGPAFPREIDDEIDEQFGFDYPDRAVRGHLQNLYDGEILKRLPNGLYYDGELEGDAELECLKRRDREVRQCAKRKDLRSFSTEELWLFARYFNYIGQAPRASRILDKLLSRDASEHERSKWRALQREVRSGQEEPKEDSEVENLVTELLE